MSNRLGKSLKDLIEEARRSGRWDALFHPQMSEAEWRAEYENYYPEIKMKNWKAREYSILREIHTVTGVPMEKIGVIGGENCVMVLMGASIAQTDLTKLNSVLQPLGCLAHIIWL